MTRVAIATLAAWLASVAVASDAAPREKTPAPSARLEEAYRKAKDPDARFWIVDALQRRLETEGDERALEALLNAARDSQPDVRRRALAAIESWRTLPSEARERWLARVAAAAAGGTSDKAPRVREAAFSLKGVLKAPPGAREPSAAGGAPRKSRRRAAASAALWAICAQLAVLFWARLAFSVLRQSGERGALGLASVMASVDRTDHLVFPCLAVSLLVCLTGVGGGLALVAALAPAARQVSARTWAAGAIGMYLACGLAAFIPAALLARRAARGDAPAGAFRALWDAQRDLPGCLALGAAVLVSRPLEPWRGLFAAAASAAPGSSWRTGWRDAVAFAVEDAAAWLVRPFSQGPLLAVFLAAPVILALASVPPQVVGAPPIGLFELFFVSDSGFAWIFGVWASGMVVSGFLGLWLAGAAIHAAGALRRP